MSHNPVAAARTVEELKARNGSATLRALLPGGRSLFIHSAYDPEGEAQRWAEQLAFKSEDLIVVYGLGLGYHLSALAEKLHPNNRVIVVEPDGILPEDLRNRASHRLGNALVAVVNSWEEFKKVHEAEIEKWRNMYFAKLPAYVELAPDHYRRFLQKFKQELLRVAADRITVHKFALQWQFNLLKNLRYLPESAPVASLFGGFDRKPAIIVSAGPSLEKNLHLLPQAKGRALILAVGTVARLLKQRGILPDLVISFDGGLPNYRHFEGVSLPDTPFQISVKY